MASRKRQQVQQSFGTGVVRKGAGLDVHQHGAGKVTPEPEQTKLMVVTILEVSLAPNGAQT